MSYGCVLGGPGSTGAALWAAAHPDEADDPTWMPCCASSAMAGDPIACLCWQPVYDTAQAPARPGEPQVRERACDDCAYKPGSPERGNDYEAEHLLSLPADGTPFYCHDGMRRPVMWRHPDGRTITGDPADYHPEIVAGVPYQADGSPGLLCAGWAARRPR